MDNKITLEAHGSFPFTFYIEKAVPTQDGDTLYVEGIASTLNVDHDNERMAKEALVSMCNIINEKSVPLRYEHNKSDDAVIGNVFKAWVDDRSQLWIKAALDPKHPIGPELHSNMKKGVAKMGLSVGGRVKSAVREMVESAGKYIKTFYDVALDEVSVTNKPANYDSWLVAKSIKDKGEDIEPFYNSPLHKQFLFENQQLDYMQSFAKSIPDKEWKKVEKKVDNKDNNKNKNMDDKKDEEKKDEAKKAEEGMKDEKKDEAKEKSFASSEDFNTLKSMFTKGFSAIAETMNKMYAKMADGEAKDTTNPDKSKEKQDGDLAVGKDGNGKAKDQTNTDKDKETPVGGETIKAREGQEEAGGNGGDESKESQGKSGKGVKKADDDKKDEDPMDKAMSILSTLNKKLEGVKKADDDKKDDDKEMDKDGKDEAKDLEEMGTAKKSASIDQFALTVAKSIQSVVERVEKGGARVPGLTQMIVDAIKTDKGIQAEISGMMQEKGFKKSVTMNVPYMVTKDGKKYALKAEAVGDKSEIQKSMKGKSFKDVYQQNFSSVSGDGQEE